MLIKNNTVQPKISIEDEFDAFLADLELQNKRKYTRNERRELFRKFQKNKKRKK